MDLRLEVSTYGIRKIIILLNRLSNKNWRRGWASNPRYGYPYNGCRDRCNTGKGLTLRIVRHIYFTVRLTRKVCDASHGTRPFARTFSSQRSAKETRGIAK